MIHEETYESDIENKKPDVTMVKKPLEKEPIDLSGLIDTKLNKKELPLKTMPELYDEELVKLKSNHLLYNLKEKETNFKI